MVHSQNSLPCVARGRTGLQDIHMHFGRWKRSREGRPVQKWREMDGCRRMGLRVRGLPRSVSLLPDSGPTRHQHPLLQTHSGRALKGPLLSTDLSIHPPCGPTCRAGPAQLPSFPASSLLGTCLPGEGCLLPPPHCISPAFPGFPCP